MGELRLLDCEPSDAAEILAGQFAAFSAPYEPFFFVLFPETEERERALKRMLEQWTGDASARYVKVVDETGEIVSAAKWCMYDKPLTEEQLNEKIHVDWHPDTDTNAWAEHLINWIHHHRLERTKGARCCVLDMMSTRPTQQHRGAASMLVKWGTDIADMMGVKSFIEGTIIARRLYEKHGFVVTPNEWIHVPVPEKWKSRPEIRYFFYERPAKEPSNGQIA